MTNTEKKIRAEIAKQTAGRFDGSELSVKDMKLLVTEVEEYGEDIETTVRLFLKILF